MQFEAMAKFVGQYVDIWWNAEDGSEAGMGGVLVWIDRGDYMVDYGYGGRIESMTRISSGENPNSNENWVFCGGPAHRCILVKVYRGPDGYCITTGRDFVGVLCDACRVHLLAREAEGILSITERSHA